MYAIPFKYLNCKGNLVLPFSCISLVLFFVLGLVCGSGCNDFSNVDVGKAVVNPELIAFPFVSYNDSSERDFTITNSGKGTLKIMKLSFVPRNGGSTKGLLVKGNLGGLVAKGDGSLEGEIQILSRATLALKVVYTSLPGVPAPDAVLRIATNDFTQKGGGREGVIEVPITAIEGKSELVVSPEPLRFKRSLGGGQVVDTRKLVVRNKGNLPLILSRLTEVFSDKDEFVLNSSGFGNLEETRNRFSISQPVVLLPYDAAKAAVEPNKYEVEWTVKYLSSATGSGVGRMTIFHRDFGATQDQTFNVTLEATTSGPCIYVYPIERNFGQVPIGTSKEDSFRLFNCGSEELVIKKLSITQNTPDNAFKLLNKTPLAAIPAGSDSDVISLSYNPIREGYDQGVLMIESNDSTQPTLNLHLVGRGSDGACPVVKAGGYVEGEAAILSDTVAASPLDYVILDASQSSDPDGRVVGYRWKVLKVPQGGSRELEPLASDPKDKDLSRRRYRPLVAGQYEIEVSVVDNEGFASCTTKVITIDVKPKKRIHIELTWTNPEDPDETDQLGSDVDLHLVKMGPGKWFDTSYDLYYKVWEHLRRVNQTFADWNPEHPTLDIDDRDGAGPENIQLDNPEKCGWYAVGIDYFKSIYGTAYATVRVYINQKMVFEESNLELRGQGEFVDVARIYWDGSDGTVFSVNKTYTARPLKQKPELISEMAPPLCTAQGLF